jgi:hypothetical protein
MSNLEDRNAARTCYLEPHATPAYPKLGATVEKHRRLNDETPEGRKAYGQAVLAAIRTLQRSALNRELPSHSSPCASGTWHSEGKDILKAVNAQNRARCAANIPAKSEFDERCDYFSAMLEKIGMMSED